MVIVGVCPLRPETRLHVHREILDLEQTALFLRAAEDDRYALRAFFPDGMPRPPVRSSRPTEARALRAESRRVEFARRVLEAVNAATNGLSPAARKALKLAASGLPAEEIAANCGLSARHCRRVTDEAIERIAEELGWW